MLSSSWRVSIIISWNPYFSLTAGKAKQELALTIYNKRHRNIQRLSDLPRDTTLMSVNLGREHGWYPGSWEPELLWHLRPCSWCLNDEMPSASLSNAPASSFHWERGDVLEEAEPRGVQLHNADPTSPFLAVTPVKSFFWAKQLKRTREVWTCGYGPPASVHCQLSHWAFPVTRWLPWVSSGLGDAQPNSEHSTPAPRDRFTIN